MTKDSPGKVAQTIVPLRQNAAMLRDVASIADLAAAAVALGAASVGELTAAERELAAASEFRLSASAARRLASAIRAGRDPLGDVYGELRTAEERRPLGQTYTPDVIVKAMVKWAKSNGSPVRVVDPGAGSGRFIVAAGKAFPDADLVASDIDPLAALMTRAALAATGTADRASVTVGDYRALDLPKLDGPTLFIGNPPYVRHHLIDASWKRWLSETADRHGVESSGLAGLHAHFFLATAEHARPGDYGVLITSAEWLDVNYGKLIRQLLVGELGGVGLHVIEPEAMPFADAATTGAIAAFKVGSEPQSMKLRRVEDAHQLGALAGGVSIKRERLVEARRWTPLTRAPKRVPEGYVELGELCRVHRGTVTGSNRVWVVAPDADLPEAYLTPTVTKARELFLAGAHLNSTEALRRVLDLPVDLDSIEDADDRARVDEYLAKAKRAGVDKGYVASTRRAWWSVGLREPAPILATYMARRPPTFVRNLADARHINIAHGLYPREPLTDKVLDALAASLRESISLHEGRTYAGGLTKFEPREMERLYVPHPDQLVGDG